MPLFPSPVLFPDFYVLFLFPHFLPCSISISCRGSPPPPPPFFTIHNYCILYCLSWQDLPFLPLNRFWLVVGILPRLPTSLPAAQPLPIHCIGYTTPYSQTKMAWLGLSCLLPLFVFTTFIWIRVNLLPYLPLWHASSGSSSYFTFFGWDVISIWHFSPKKFERNPQNRLPLSPHCGHNGKCQSHPLVIWFRNHEYSVLSRNDH